MVLFDILFSTCHVLFPVRFLMPFFPPSQSTDPFFERFLKGLLGWFPPFFSFPQPGCICFCPPRVSATFFSRFRVSELDIVPPRPLVAGSLLCYPRKSPEYLVSCLPSPLSGNEPPLVLLLPVQLGLAFFPMKPLKRRAFGDISPLIDLLEFLPIVPGVGALFLVTD